MALRHTHMPALHDAPHNAISHTISHTISPTRSHTISHTIRVSGERFPGGELVGLHRSGTESTEGVTDRNARPSRTCVLGIRLSAVGLFLVGADECGQGVGVGVHGLL